MPYLSKRSLEGLRNYAYKPSGYTILDELHQPIWNCELVWLVLGSGRQAATETCPRRSNPSPQRAWQPTAAFAGCRGCRTRCLRSLAWRAFHCSSLPTTAILHDVLAAAHTAHPCPALPPCLPADITNNWLPMWLAPNLITLIGLFALLSSYALGAFYLPEFAGEAPRWFYLFKCVVVLRGAVLRGCRSSRVAAVSLLAWSVLWPQPDRGAR